MPVTILIIGKESYIGNSFQNRLNRFSGNYRIEKISVRDSEWETKDFSGYDVIVYVSAIVHQKDKKYLRELYDQVNCETVVRVATKAKREGVKQFIFMSSMSVYGVSQGTINHNTVPKPDSLYGKSKLSAEKELAPLDSEHFAVVMIRPPMVYGKNCKGNYIRLSSLAKKVPVFLKTANKRSMIYIDNLSEFIRLMIDNHERGIFFPQNAEYVNTKHMVTLIAEANGKKMHFIAIPNIMLNLLLRIAVFHKVFGSLVYEQAMSRYPINYQVVDFEESIKQTETKSF